MAGMEGGAMEWQSAWRCTAGTRRCWCPLPFLLHSSSPLPDFTQSPVYLSASNIPNYWFICFKWTVDMEVEFFLIINLPTCTYRHTPLTADLHIMSHIFFFLHNNPLPISVSKTTTPSVSYGFATKSVAGDMNKYWKCSFSSPLCEILEMKRIMIENWFLMRCLQTVHPGMH